MTLPPALLEEAEAAFKKHDEEECEFAGCEFHFTEGVRWLWARLSESETVSGSILNKLEARTAFNLAEKLSQANARVKALEHELKLNVTMVHSRNQRIQELEIDLLTKEMQINANRPIREMATSRADHYQKRAEELEAALEFYARNDIHSIDFNWRDNGEVARQALKPKGGE